MKKKIYAFITLVLAAFLLTGCNSSDYRKASEAFSAGNYEEAKAAFEQLRDYKDSSDMALECGYQIACGILSDGGFEDALKAFTELSEYKDSAEKITECRYGIAGEKFDAGDFEGALADFTELKDYKDSAEKITECKYDIAKEKLTAGSFRDAIEIFTELGEYNDSKELLSEAADKLIEAELPGTYETGNLDYSGLFLDSLAAGFGDSGLDYEEMFKDVRLEMNTIVTFTDDGKVIQSVDEESFEQSIDSVKQVLTDVILAYFEEMLKEELEAQGLTPEIMYALTGTDNISDLLMNLAGVDISAILDESFDSAFSEIELETEGTYVIKNGTITVTDSTEKPGSFVLDTETGELTLTEEEPLEGMEDMFPMTFRRVK